MPLNHLRAHRVHNSEAFELHPARDLWRLHRWVSRLDRHQLWATSSLHEVDCAPGASLPDILPTCYDHPVAPVV